jgi:hypothetical protein
MKSKQNQRKPNMINENQVKVSVGSREGGELECHNLLPDS